MCDPSDKADKYADPEARFYEGKYYIYVTRSFTRFEDQMNIDAFSSSDLIHWEKHEGIIDMSGYPYVHRAVWAPTITEKNGKYYLMFASLKHKFHYYHSTFSHQQMKQSLKQNDCECN